jgi:putative tryptophan/tyrosine transport system substrate-binding protein
MTRRTIEPLITLARAILVATLIADAQPPAKVPRIGFLGPSISGDDPRAENFRHFQEGLREFGYVEGQNRIVEWRLAEHYERYPSVAAELVRLNVDVIVVTNTPGTLAAKHATTTIPIVMVTVGDPVSTGLVASLARPGGNITGITVIHPELSGKRLELLKEVAPGVSRVAVLLNPDNPMNWRTLREAQDAARALGITMQAIEVRGPQDFEHAFAEMIRERADGLTAILDPVTLNNRRRIVDFAAKSRLPAIYNPREFVDVGGLMSDGPSRNHQFRRAATYVDKILKGAKPADLPVEQPIKFELVINFKTAQALGLTIPPTLLFQADEVIR